MEVAETEEDLDRDPTVPSRQLGAFRWVSENPAGKDRTELHRSTRKLIEENRKEFNRQWAALEKEYREGLRAAEKEAKTAQVEEEADKGEAILGRLLGEKPWTK